MDGEITTEKQVNIKQHDESEFQKIIQQGLKEGGINLTAMKCFGKSRTLFNICSYLQSLPNVRVYIFDGSEAFLYGYSKIPVYTIAEHDIQLSEIRTSQDVEVYQFINWQLVKLALSTYPSLLFRLKSKSPSKRGFAIRSIINYLDDLQRAEKEQSPTHENRYKIAYTIDEFADVFSNRSTLRIDAETFLTTFNEGRNFGESFFTCLQREFDGSKTLRAKQIMAYGKIPECDKSAYHRRLEKQYNVNLSNMQPRTWLIEGKIITAPTWTQRGKPYIINQAIREKWFNSMPKAEPEKPKSSLTQLMELLFPMLTIRKNLKERQTMTQLKDDSSEFDGILGINDENALFPNEP